eukprot:Gb_24759 [translate_table: standard]
MRPSIQETSLRTKRIPQPNQEIIPVSPEDLLERGKDNFPIEEVQQLEAKVVGMWTKPSVQRKTKIVCTIGPSTSTPEMIQKLVEEGMNVHGDEEVVDAEDQKMDVVEPEETESVTASPHSPSVLRPISSTHRCPDQAHPYIFPCISPQLHLSTVTSFHPIAIALCHYRRSSAILPSSAQRTLVIEPLPRLRTIIRHWSICFSATSRYLRRNDSPNVAVPNMISPSATIHRQTAWQSIPPIGK